MKAHSEEQFKVFMSQLKETNATLDFFCDFKKIGENVEQISMKLNQLNYLIGQMDMKGAILRLWEENPRVFSILDILIAVRKKDRKQVINSQGEFQFMERYFETAEGVIEFIKDTGLWQVLSNKKVTNLVDYVFGVETGLDTNARKNRSGHQMEGTVSHILQVSDIPFRSEVYSREYADIADALGTDEKRFDFVVETSVKTYLMEVNFYSGGGSKLNEVARAYTDLAPKINGVEGYEFVWITDGKGWESARNKFEEAYYAIPCVYNLTTITSLIARIKAEL